MHSHEFIKKNYQFCNFLEVNTFNDWAILIFRYFTRSAADVLASATGGLQLAVVFRLFVSCLLNQQMRDENLSIDTIHSLSPDFRI